MLDVSTTHPFAASAAFATQFLKLIAAYDLAGARALIDEDASGDFEGSFPPPEGFTYADPDVHSNWRMHVVAQNAKGFALAFDLPFAEKHFRAMDVRFYMERVGDKLRVVFEAVVPT